jgi:hypothetical protein
MGSQESPGACEISPVTVIGVYEDEWKKAPDFPAAYTFVLRLSATPSSRWVQVFDHEYHLAWYNMKRRAEIYGARLVMIVADSDNLQHTLISLRNWSSGRTKPSSAISSR